MITGEPVFDGIGTLAIGLVLFAIAFVLAREMRSLLIGESAAPELERQIDAEFERAPEIRRVIHTLTQHIGPDELLIAAKVEFDPDLTTEQLVDAINAARGARARDPGDRHGADLRRAGHRRARDGRRGRPAVRRPLTSTSGRTGHGRSLRCENRGRGPFRAAWPPRAPAGATLHRALREDIRPRFAALSDPPGPDGGALLRSPSAPDGPGRRLRPLDARARASSTPASTATSPSSTGRAR